MNTLRPIPFSRHLLNRWSCAAVRREDIAVAKLLAFILAVYAFAGTMDYQDALLTEAQAEARTQAKNATLSAARLAKCLNGGMTGLYSTDVKGNRLYIVCDKAWEVSNENVKVKL